MHADSRTYGKTSTWVHNTRTTIIQSAVLQNWK